MPRMTYFEPKMFNVKDICLDMCNAASQCLFLLFFFYPSCLDIVIVTKDVLRYVAASMGISCTFALLKTLFDLTNVHINI